MLVMQVVVMLLTLLGEGIVGGSGGYHSKRTELFLRFLDQFEVDAIKKAYLILFPGKR